MTSRKRRRVMRPAHLVQGQVGCDQGYPRKVVRQHHYRYRVTAKPGNVFGMPAERMPSVGDHGFTDRAGHHGVELPRPTSPDRLLDGRQDRIRIGRRRFAGLDLLRQRLPDITAAPRGVQRRRSARNVFGQFNWRTEPPRPVFQQIRITDDDDLCLQLMPDTFQDDIRTNSGRLAQSQYQSGEWTHAS